MQNDDHQPDRPTLEDLLQLKRRERPTEAFWSEFDARLREKQLAALIPVSTPWTRWYSFAGRYAKLGLPVAAAAAIAVGVVTLNRQQWQAGDHLANDGRPQEHVLVGTGSAKPAPAVAQDDSSKTEGTVQTVVIHAAPSVAAVANARPASRVREQELNPEEITRSLPWLADVELKNDKSNLGIHVSDSLQVDKGPAPVVVSAFEDSRPKQQPVWAPTEQNIRDAVASEVGLAPSYGSTTQRAWMARVVAANERSRLTESRIESDYSRADFSRVGLTASTLSIKF